METSEACLAELYAECIRASGVHPACDRFFQIFRPILGRIAFRVAQQFDAREETDDLIQEISLKLARKDLSVLAGLPREPSASLAYFSVMAVNAARDFFRARNATKRGLHRTISLDAALDSISEGVSHEPERMLLLSQIEDCLPPDRKSRVVFRLYYRQGFSAKEIAAIPALELSVKGVESLIHRIILHLRHRLFERKGRVTAGGGSSGLNPS